MIDDNYIPHGMIPTKEEFSDDAFIEDLFNSLSEKKEKHCKHCQYNKNDICRNSCKIPIRKINYCSRWFKEES